LEDTARSDSSSEPVDSTSVGATEPAHPAEAWRETAVDGPIDWTEVSEVAGAIDRNPELLYAGEGNWRLKVFQEARDFGLAITNRWHEPDHKGVLLADWAVFARQSLQQFCRKSGLLDSGRALLRFQEFPKLEEFLSVMVLREAVNSVLVLGMTMDKQSVRSLAARWNYLVHQELVELIASYNIAHGTSMTLESFLVYRAPVRAELGKFANVDDYKFHLNKIFNDFILEGLELGSLKVDDTSQAADIFLDGFDTASTEAGCLKVLADLATRWPTPFADFYERERLRLLLPGAAPQIPSRERDPFKFAIAWQVCR
jgi:hypothetical protein